MKPRFTPGPWSLKPLNEDLDRPAIVNGEHIIALLGQGEFEKQLPSSQVNANMVVISLVPEMYEIIMEIWNNRDKYPIEIVSKIRKKIMLSGLLES